MELRQLRYFDKVAELRSFSKAAGALHMTQPSLSRQVLALEREVGAPLLTRTPRGVELTGAGLGLQRHLQGIFAQLERIPEVVRTASRAHELLRVGVPPGLPGRWGMAVLQQVERELPRVRLSLHESSTEEQRTMLQDGHIDLGLIHMAAPELRCTKVLVQQLGAAVPPTSPLAGHRVLDFAQLDGLRVMAHAIGEVNAEEARLRSAAADAEAHIQWLFRRFSEHSRLIASAAKADAVLITQVSSERQFPGWTWIPIRHRSASGAGLDIRTWAARLESAPPTIEHIVGVMHEVAASMGAGTGWD